MMTIASVKAFSRTRELVCTTRCKLLGLPFLRELRNASSLPDLTLASILQLLRAGRVLLYRAFLAQDRSASGRSQIGEARGLWLFGRNTTEIRPLGRCGTGQRNSSTGCDPRKPFSQKSRCPPKVCRCHPRGILQTDRIDRVVQLK